MCVCVCGCMSCIEQVLVSMIMCVHNALRSRATPLHPTHGDQPNICRVLNGWYQHTVLGLILALGSSRWHAHLHLALL